MECLTEGTLWNVLSRLPVKELMRCKCVCKSWFDLITDPNFISNHYLLYNSLEVQQQEHLLLLRTPIRTLIPVETEISILSWNSNEPKGLVSSHVLKPPPDQYWWSYIMGPCNGIYFLNGFPDIIMNPSLSQFFILPPRPHLPYPLGTSLFSRHYPRFGFDLKTNDYKVVIISQRCITFEVSEMNFTVELYSFNSNSWNIFQDNPIPFPFALVNDRSQVFTYVNNCCHWWGCLYKSNKNESNNVWSGKDESDDVECAVLSFDMVSESFRMIKMPKMPIITPPSTPRNHSNLIGLIVMSDKDIIPFSESGTIGIIDCYDVGQGTAECFCFDVWMLKDYWDEGSWIKQYSVSPMPVIYRRFLGYYGSNRYLWNEAHTTLVLSGLDGLNSKENIRDLLACGKSQSIAAVRYMESLVSLQRGAQF